MRRILFTAAFALAAMTPATASAEACADAATMTGYSPYYVDCRGAFSGNINGSAGEMTYLAAQFGYTFFYHGKSDDGASGPFASNPGGTSGTLSFDAPVFGLFVVGIKASNQFSYYLFDAGATGLSSVPFETIGTATNSKGKPQGLSHVAFYSVDDTPFIVECVPGGPGCQITTPEPSTYALMGTGLLAVGFVSRRRRRA